MTLHRRCQITTTFIGFGDLLYHTPIFRMLHNKGIAIDVWARNPEPFMGNHHITNLYKIVGSRIPIPTMFYPWGHFIVGNQMAGVSHPHSHVVDYVTANVFRSVLLAEDKSLDLFWSTAQWESARELLRPALDIGVHCYHVSHVPILAMSPVIGWPSRTMPVEWYAEIATRVRAQGFKVVLVGKDIDPKDIGSDNPRLDEFELKRLHPADAIPHDLCLYNRTTLHELAAIYDQTDVVLTTETGHLPLAGCSNRPHIVYVASLIHPEFRMPFRKGWQNYKSTILHTEGKYYPPYARMLESGLRLTDCETKPASAEDTADACIKALRKARDAN
jgi:ADP-heptose:LPS heptosyltransferase